MDDLPPIVPVLAGMTLVATFILGLLYAAWLYIWTPDCDRALAEIADAIRPPPGWVEPSQDDTCRRLLRGCPAVVAAITGATMMVASMLHSLPTQDDWLILLILAVIAASAAILLRPSAPRSESLEPVDGVPPREPVEEWRP